MFPSLIYRTGFAAVTCAAFIMLAPAARAEQDVWPALKQQSFGDRQIQAEDGAVILEIPGTAEDASLVPLTVRVSPAVTQKLKSLTLFVDKNPNPLVASLNFLPCGRLRRRTLFLDSRAYRYVLPSARRPRDRGWHAPHGDEIRGSGWRLRSDAGQGPRRRDRRSRQDDRQDLPACAVVEPDLVRPS